MTKLLELFELVYFYQEVSTHCYFERQIRTSTALLVF